MEQQQKSPVGIVQKFISIHTTRKELSERMAKNPESKSVSSKLSEISEQSERFTKTLLDELSGFGDAVQSEVNRDDEYHQAVNPALATLDTLDNPSLLNLLEQAEAKLKALYEDVLTENPDMPETVQAMLSAQIEEISK